MTAFLQGGCGYSRIHELGERAGEARSEIEVQLQRRAELVPTLVETVQRYGTVGEDVIGAVADARAGLVGAVRSADLSGMETAFVELSDALEQLLAEATRLADVQADPGFQLLRSQLEGTEEQIIEAAGAYNEAVSRYNDYISGFPQIVTAKVVGAERLEPFEPPAEPSSVSSGDE